MLLDVEKRAGVRGRDPVDSEQVVNRIVLAPSQVVDAEMEIVNTPMGESDAEDEGHPAEIDLSFLRSYRN